MKVAVLTNPKSGWNRKNPAAAAAVLSGFPEVRHIVPDDGEDGLALLRDNPPDILVINGGDGTLDHVVTKLRRGTFTKEPAIALLAGGTTNMTHRSAGIQGKPDRALQSLLLFLARAEGMGGAMAEGNVPTVSQPVLSVEKGEGGQVFFGFFFGCGAIPRAILHTRKTLHGKGMTGKLSEGLAVARMTGRLLTGDIRKDEILKPEGIQYSFDNWNWRDMENVFLYVTVLPRLLLGICPHPPEGGFSVAGLNIPYRMLPFHLPALWLGKTVADPYFG
jgi:hypothetical protein